MDGDLSWAILGAVAGAAVTLALVGLALLLRGRSRADLVAQVDAAHREADDLRLQLDIARARLQGHTGRRTETHRETQRETPEYVITDVGAAVLVEAHARPVERPVDAPPVDRVEVPDRWVLSATVGAPLVKAAAFTHGLRRALSAESRNRIRFQMRQEVRAARKRRKQAFKQYQRDVRAAERASEAV